MSTQTIPPINAKLQKTINRFNTKINSGSYYELLLTLQTIVNRYIPSKNYQDATELLYHAVLKLLEHDQNSLLYDGIIRLIEIFKLEQSDSTTTAADSYQAQLTKLLQLLDKFPYDDPTLKDLSKESISFSIASSPYKLGDPLLNFLFAQKFLQGNNIESGEPLLLISGQNNVKALDIYVNLLVKLSESDAQLKPTHLVGRLVLNYLYVENVKFAQLGLEKFIDKLGITSKGQQYKEIIVFEQDEYKLLNFYQLLIQIIRKSNRELGSAFKTLVNRYRDELTKLELGSQVDFIGSQYFQIVQQNNQNNMMLNLLSGFMGK